MSNYIDQPADADPYAAGSFGNYNPSDGYQPSDSYMASEGYGVPVSGDAYGSAHDPYAANDPYAAPAAHGPYAEPVAQQQPAAIRVRKCATRTWCRFACSGRALHDLIGRFCRADGACQPETRQLRYRG